MTKRITRIVVILLAAVSVAIFVCMAIVNGMLRYSDDTPMDSFAPAARQDHAQHIVDALNTHDPAKLTSMWTSSSGREAEVYNAYTQRIIKAAMPLPGCSYHLDSVQPRGEEVLPDAPWVFQHDAYRYDMMLTENCPGHMPLARIISVLSTRGEGGHWTEVFFEIRQ